MEVHQRQAIRQRVLEYLQGQASPVGLASIATDVRKKLAVRDSDILNVVQSMIVTGKLKNASGLKIELPKPAANTI